MKSVGTLRKKGLPGAEHFYKKDKNKHSASNSSSPASSGSIAATSSMASSMHPPTVPVMTKTTAPITIDLHRFADDKLQPQEFVRKTLSGTNEEGIRGFYKSLLDAKHVVGGDLQRNVLRNYTEFVSISKEISSLDADVLKVKETLNELKMIWEGFLASTNNTTTDAANSDNDNDNKGAMKGLYKAQIMALWEKVEGSQRFIQHVQNRRIIKEFTHFHEINPKTLQPQHMAQLYLLNDCLLLARRKANRNLIAERCWNLHDLTIVDMKDSSNLTNAVRIVAYPETFIYHAERVEDKMSLLYSYKRLIDDHDDKQLDTRLLGNSSSLPPDIEKLLVDLPDQLEVMIALREFEKSVVYLEKARQFTMSTSSSFPIIREARDQIEHYTDELCTIISKDLSNTLLTKIQFQRYVNWLLRLGKSEKARQVFLETRTVIIRKRIRQLIFEGDTTTYISELALVVFTLIRNTCEWYRDSFRQNDMASGFVTWVRDQTEAYADIYKKQVFGQGHLNCQVIADCFKSTLEQCSILKKVGLDFRFILEDLFLDNVKETVIAYQKRNVEKINKFVDNENFHVVSGQGLGNDVKVTSSVISFYNLLIKFSNDICLLSTLQVTTRLTPYMQL
ncbi:Cullin repeat-like-containing domain protein [Mycotypha africana]|uniref:Cullin repeat-like-containing domain protein n=1 Tax=Mycotypha africana TaxID=64632 RepID=UPI0023019357|nr:Cullin repeat-like-containing domain protein [Mycotypha africana]KAI8977021.1 Cullin repeat-like-containing domain protein [Mycotypha africana]